jgi:hypothetical protein
LVVKHAVWADYRHDTDERSRRGGMKDAMKKPPRSAS